MASKVMPGTCLTVPVHDAVVIAADLPVGVKSTLSMPKMEGCPFVCRCVAIKAVNVSPSSTYDPV